MTMILENGNFTFFLLGVDAETMAGGEAMGAGGGTFGGGDDGGGFARGGLASGGEEAGRVATGAGGGSILIDLDMLKLSIVENPSLFSQLSNTSDSYLQLVE
ncbi:hypothetical protein FNV43_RR14986 [Rhamnella rubrinervis]|uniref:Uncharacterized protein n=1 Tax=Rhamnella rubrinervis TaxID=2594499 RepID=A0A8K0H3T4_9ROSA|nr:hypothetical protein FNV43_RR14986 [Rhamnella rubrinervis]